MPIPQGAPYLLGRKAVGGSGRERSEAERLHGGGDGERQSSAQPKADAACAKEAIPGQRRK